MGLFKSLTHFAMILTVLILCGLYVVAQTPEKLVKKWVAEDIRNLAVVSRLPPGESLTRDTLKSAFGEEGYNLDFEFGAKGFGNGKSGGYTVLTASVQSFRDIQISFKISILTSRSSWQLIRSQFIDAWSRTINLPFKETDRGLVYEVINREAMDAYKRSIVEVIGETPAVTIPDDLREDYTFLTAPFQEIEVSDEPCGYGATAVPGKVAIEKFLRANRIDLIENILRGYNQGGRTLAAIALLKLRKNGYELNPGTLETIQNILNLDIPIKSCAGCLGFTTTAKELISQYKLQ